MTSTLWKNDKTGTIYRVWTTATDNQGGEFVIYQKQEIPKTNQSAYLVRHSENLLIGKCELLPFKDNWRWFVKFDNNQDGADKQLPWCRPSYLWLLSAAEAWFEKFTPLNWENIS